MNGEFNFLGVFVPSLLVYSGVAFLVQQMICRCLLRFGAYRFIWHRPLFDTAMFVVLVALVLESARILFK